MGNTTLHLAKLNKDGYFFSFNTLDDFLGLFENNPYSDIAVISNNVSYKSQNIVKYTYKLAKTKKPYIELKIGDKCIKSSVEDAVVNIIFNIGYKYVILECIVDKTILKIPCTIEEMENLVSLKKLSSILEGKKVITPLYNSMSTLVKSFCEHLPIDVQNSVSYTDVNNAIKHVLENAIDKVTLASNSCCVEVEDKCIAISNLYFLHPLNAKSDYTETITSWVLAIAKSASSDARIVNFRGDFYSIDGIIKSKNKEEVENYFKLKEV